MIKIKCDYVGGAVAVPTEVIDKHLKLAPAASFKVLLFIFRNPESSVDAEQIALCTGLSEADVKDCLSFWESNGVIAVDAVTDELLKKSALGNAKITDTPKGNAYLPKPTADRVRCLPVKKPTQREIALRISEEPELTVIYNEAQAVLGTFGYDTQALILMIYDYYGFPPEVIITLLQHQKTEGKTSSAAIKSMAEDWAKRGIDSLEAVETELLALEKIDEVYEEIKNALGENTALSPRIAKYIREWAVNSEYSSDLIIYALEESSRVVSDANKLLKKWANTGLKTPEQVMEKNKKILPKQVRKSYDTNKVGRSSVLDWAAKFSEEEENK